MWRIRKDSAISQFLRVPSKHITCRLRSVHIRRQITWSVKAGQVPSLNAKPGPPLHPTTPHPIPDLWPSSPQCFRWMLKSRGMWTTPCDLVFMGQNWLAGNHTLVMVEDKYFHKRETLYCSDNPYRFIPSKTNSQQNQGKFTYVKTLLFQEDQHAGRHNVNTELEHEYATQLRNRSQVPQFSIWYKHNGILTLTITTLCKQCQLTTGGVMPRSVSCRSTKHTFMT